MNNQLRIIGGVWRSRKISFPDAKGLRPTPARVRETLFNWLNQRLDGLNCLDLFAGSGALGFEAASRSAKHVLLVEQDDLVCRSLDKNRTALAADCIQIIHSDAKRFLSGAASPFDLVFLDPPFHQAMIEPICQMLENNHWLSNQARIYIEAEHAWKPEDLPDNWQIIRTQKAGEVGYHLFQRAISK